jgi:hypothetical protein
VVVIFSIGSQVKSRDCLEATCLAGHNCLFLRKLIGLIIATRKY